MQLWTRECPFSSYQSFISFFLPPLLTPSPQTVTVAMGGQWLLVGVAPDRKQLTTVQEVDKKGHTEAQTRKENYACVCVCMCVCVCASIYIMFVSIIMYVDHCFQ